MKLTDTTTGWQYCSWRAILYFNGKRFALVTPNGKDGLSDKDAALLLDALTRPTQNAGGQRPCYAASRIVAKDVCRDLVLASWLQSISPKAQGEIRAAVRKLARHFRIRGYKWKP